MLGARWGKPGEATSPRCTPAAPLVKIQCPGNPQRRPRKKTTILVLEVADYTKAFPFLLDPTRLMRPRSAAAKREGLTMSEHLIRFRGGWLRLDPDALPNLTAIPPGPRVSLPITWPEEAGSGVVVRLVRSFGVPPLDPARESLALRLADVGGLVSAHLNGREIARPAPGTTAPGGRPCPTAAPAATSSSSTWTSQPRTRIPGSLLRPWGSAVGPW